MKKIQLYSLLLFAISIFYQGNIVAQEAKLSLETIYKAHAIYPEFVSGIHSMSDGEHYFVFEDNSINQYSYKTGEKIKTILSGEEMIPDGDTNAISIRNHTFSHQHQPTK